MRELSQRVEYEEKMEQITEQLEEMILEAILCVIIRIREKNLTWMPTAPINNKDDGMF